MEISQDAIEAFQSLFRGRIDAWGSVEGKANKEAVTPEHYQRHLRGEVSLGVYPLLDDGTCHFFAIDLDEKDFNKAKAIRQELFNSFIPAYIAESKSKGYHIYAFASEKFIAKDIRRVLHQILNKLNIKAEVFPKQDSLDKMVSLGNYINLPCFGNTRPFLTGDMRGVPLEIATTKIKFTPEESIFRFLKILPEEKPLTPKKVRGRQKKHPPCIESLLRGVDQGQRDEAAFALARHYLDQYYLPEEVLSLLKVWDLKNTPPLNDDRMLETKVRSAEKGYQFGCSSVEDNPMLSHYCVGEEKCGWLKEVTRERKKKGLIKELTFYENEDNLYEQLFVNGEVYFVAYEKKTGKVTHQASIETPEYTVIPILSDELTEGAITLPTGVEEYGDTLALVDSLKQHIHDYVDIPETFLEFAVWYIIMSWIYDKLSTVSYLRFTGDTGVGKSRSLDAIGRLCYKPLMMSGAVTPAPIYRLIRRFRGTMVLDEADFRESSEKAEVITILNSGFERNRPVIRCSKDNPDNLEILPCFGPKVFATRYRFTDVALESRCLTHTMEETDRDDIPPLLGEAYYKREMSLRNKLLLWRLKNLDLIDPKAVDEIDLGMIEPRLKQTSLPFAIVFKNMPGVLDRFKKFIKKYNAELIGERADSYQGKIVYTMFQLAREIGKDFLTPDAIANEMKEQYKEVTARSVGKRLKSLNIQRKKKVMVGKQARYVVWDERLMKKLLKRYIIDPDEFEDLFPVDVDIDMEV